MNHIINNPHAHCGFHPQPHSCSTRVTTRWGKRRPQKATTINNPGRTCLVDSIDNKSALPFDKFLFSRFRPDQKSYGKCL